MGSRAVASPFWWVAFVCFGGLYILIRDSVPPHLGWILKILPIVLLLQLVQVQSTGRVRGLLTLGLALSALGDILLSLEGLFIPGLGAFLLAQLTYAGLFLTQRRWQSGRLWWVGLVLVYAVACGLVILPHTGALRLATTAYLVAISLMALSAGFRDDSRFLWVASGALVFMVSDMLIAIDKFVTPFAYADAAIMLTYYAAQALIVTGVLAGNRRAAAQSV